MIYPILTAKISQFTLVSLRDRARQVGEIFGLGKLETTQFITAVSEIARNTVQYANEGSIVFQIKTSDNQRLPQAVAAVITDKGPGIGDIDGALAGRARMRGHRPMGIIGAKRLVDIFTIECPDAGGTRVMLEKFLPRTAPALSRTDLGKLSSELAQRKPTSALEEMEKHHGEMLITLQQLQESQRELELADERKNRFLTTLAHELRNPLATLCMNLEIMKRSAQITPEELVKRRDAMSRQADQMSRLIEDLMDVSRISQDKIELRKVPVEVNDLLSQAIESSGSAIGARKHHVTFNRHCGPVWIFGDPSRLNQAFSNLIQNAARYTPIEGDIHIAISTTEKFAEIKIADNGIGISAEMLPHIFDIFVQADARSSSTLGGLGIGLTLVNRLIESHGGTVTASSEGKDKGSQFLVCLPLH